MSKDNAANIFSLVSSLSAVRRFSGVPTIKDENVLEHTGTVVICALAIAMRCEAVLPGRIGFGELLSRATVHDWDETLTGDVPRPAKYFSESLRAEFAKLEAAGVQDLTNLLRMPLLRDLHHNAKRADFEGFIVAFADVMAAAYRVWDEVLCCRNNHMVRPIKSIRSAIGKTMTRLSRDVPHQCHGVFHGLADELLGILNKANQAGSENRIVELHNNAH